VQLTTSWVISSGVNGFLHTAGISREGFFTGATATIIFFDILFSKNKTGHNDSYVFTS
jgi:hypothetical protein